MQTRPAITFRFGPFEVTPVSGELLKEGKRVRIQDLPFRLLVVLLENPGQVVTREEIQKRIWDSSTFVDFDSSLRVAVRKLREALGDDAENPRYIETIPKRGYRLLITEVRPQAGREPGEARPDFTGLKKGFLVIAVLMVLAATVTFRLLPHRRTKLTGVETLVLADFANSTGDPVFDGTLRQGMAVQLEQSPFLSLISDERMQQTLRLMGQPADALLSPEIAREVCVRTGSAAVLDGSIASLGNQYVLGLRARNCVNGDVLDEEQVQTARKEDALKALDEIAAKFRTRVGESLNTIKSHNTPLQEATTPSLEALKAYSSAVQVNFSSGAAAAVPLLKRAVEIDPKFAMAYALLGRLYGDMGETVLSAENIRKAHQLRDHASDRERFFIDAHYDRQVTGNIEKVRQTLESWIQTYPRDPHAHGMLSGFTSQGVGNYELSIQEARKAIELDPDFTPGYFNMAFSYLYLDRLDEAENTIQRAAKRKLDVPDNLMLLFYVAYLRGDKAGMERARNLSKGKPGAEDWMSHSEAIVLAQSGRLELARNMSRQAVEFALEAGDRERAAIFETGAALYEAFFGNAAPSRQRAAAALKLSKGRDVEYGAAFALSLSGDDAQAQALAGDLEKRFPEDTLVRIEYLPSLHALFALHANNPAKAVAFLQTTEPYDFAVPGIDFFGFLGGLYPTYVRGQAYLALGQGAAAAAEFQKILDHRGLVVGDPIGALVHLEQGRAYASLADKSRTSDAYREFFSFLRNADQDIPILKQAKAEYTKLQFD